MTDAAPTESPKKRRIKPWLAWSIVILLLLIALTIVGFVEFGNVPLSVEL